MADRVVIIAPHVDDEVIGCYSILSAGNVSKVIYVTDFGEVTEARRVEAIRASRMFGFDPVFCTLAEIAENTLTSTVIYAPNIADNHPHHKVVNMFVRSMPSTALMSIRYYSIDMNVSPKLLSPEDRTSKLNVLNLLYPTQAELFASDAKYFLFEELSSTDGIYEFTMELCNDTYIKSVTISSDVGSNNAKAKSLLEAILRKQAHQLTSLKDYVNLLHRIYPNTKILDVVSHTGLSYKWRV